MAAKPKANFIIGVDLGGTNLKVALLDLKYKIRDKEVLSTRRFIRKDVLIHSRRPNHTLQGTKIRRSVSTLRQTSVYSSVAVEGLISAIVDSINKIIKNNKLNRTSIQGVGLGLPGPIDVKRGIVHFFPNIPGWKEVSLKRILEKRLKLSVSLDNDAKLMALAEHRLGAARGFKNAICLTLGTGVGGGIIIEGSLYRGSSNASGEIGHLPINERGPRCNCGGEACLETYIGNNRIIKEAKKTFGKFISLEKLSALAKNHNKKARRIWQDVGRHLGIALVGVVNLLNPDCVVIGGGIAEAGKLLFDKVREIISRQAMSVQARKVKVVKARLGKNAGLIGAAILVREEMNPALPNRVGHKRKEGRGEDIY